MVDIYDMGNLTNATGLDNMLVAANQISGGVLGIGLLALVFFFVIFVFRYSGYLKAFILSGSISFFVGLILWGLKVLNPNVLIYPLIITFICLIIQIWANKGDNQ